MTMTASPLRVVVVDDSITVRKRLVEILEDQGDIKVVGEAADGLEAIEVVRTMRPDVVTLDLALPSLDGCAVTEQIMAHNPTPILIVSASFNRGEVLRTYDALAAGAVDALDKSDTDPAWDQRFVASVRMAARIKVITHPRGRLGTMGRPTTAPPAPRVAGERARAQTEIIAIGASTGGPSAIAQVLSGLPPDLHVPAVVLLHIDQPFALALGEWLASQLGRAVRFAEDGTPVGPGIFLASPGHHLVVANGMFRFTDAAPRHHCRPSVDVLFESVAAAHGPNAIGCLLTGMGKDGAAGLLAMRRAGGLTIAQDEATSVVFGMPREAVACGAAIQVLPLAEIGPTIASLMRPESP